MVLIVFVVMYFMLFISGVLVVDLTHVMAIFLRVVILVVTVVRRVALNVALNVVLMEMVAQAMIELGMVLNLMKVVMVLVVIVGLFGYRRFVPFNTSRVILEAERQDLVDLSSSLSFWRKGHCGRCSFWLVVDAFLSCRART